MTTTGSGYRQVSAGNGVATAFGVPFAVLDASHLFVELLASADASSGTPQVQGTHYTISGSLRDGTATVTFATPPAAGQYVLRERRTPRDQSLNLEPGLPPKAEPLETALDKLAMIAEEIDGRVDRITQLSDFTATVRQIVIDQLVAGTAMELTVDPVTGAITIASTAGSGVGGALTAEDVRDVIAAALTQGSGISIVYDDAGDTISITATGTYSDEMARDAIGAALVAGTGISITVNDPGDTITIAIDTVLVHEIPLMAAAWKSRTTGGATVTSFETSTNKQNYSALDFDGTTAKYAQFDLRLPKRAKTSSMSVKAKVLWTAASGTVGAGARFGIAAVALGDGDALDVAFPAATEVVDQLLGANLLHETAYTGAHSVGGSPAQNDLVRLQLSRNPADATDTLDGITARVLGVVLQLTTILRDDT